MVPYRKMVLSFPLPLRYWMQASRKLFAKVHCIVIHEMLRHYDGKAKLAGIKSPKSGWVTFAGRAWYALNLIPHLQFLMVDRVFVDVSGVFKMRG